MAQHNENRPIDGAVELLQSNGFDALAEAVTVLLNSAMVAERSEHLCALPLKMLEAEIDRYIEATLE